MVAEEIAWSPVGSTSRAFHNYSNSSVFAFVDFHFGAQVCSVAESTEFAAHGRWRTAHTKMIYLNHFDCVRLACGLSVATK